MLDLLPQFHELVQVLVFTRCLTKIYEAIERYCGEKRIAFAITSNPEEAEQLLDQAISCKPKGKWGLLIYDDFSDASTRREGAYNKISIESFRKLRNEKYNSIFITQSYSDAPASLRGNVNLMLLFGMGARGASQLAADEFGRLTGMPKVVFVDLCRCLLREKHGCITASAERIIVSMPDEHPDKLFEFDLDEHALDLFEEAEANIRAAERETASRSRAAKDTRCRAAIEDAPPASPTDARDCDFAQKS